MQQNTSTFWENITLSLKMEAVGSSEKLVATYLPDYTVSQAGFKKQQLA
jgi:hypothetical protein